MRQDRKFSVGDRVFSIESFAKGETGKVTYVEPPSKGGYMPYKVDFGNLTFWKREGNLRMVTECGHGTVVYHDKKEEWMCPFCEREK